MSETGLFRIKPPPITMPPPPPTPAISAFDYIIDIYSDKVVITNPDGTTTQLSTIAELNDWLRNITGKRIRINANVEVYSDIYLSPNEYWIFGEWIHGNVYLTGKNITIISFTRLGDYSYGGYLSNYDRQTQSYVDISGLKLFSVYADIFISGSPTMRSTDVTIYVENTTYALIERIVGDIYVRGGIVSVYECTLYNVYIEANQVSMDYVSSGDYMGSWVVVARERGATTSSVDPRNAFYVFFYIRNIYLFKLPARSTVATGIPELPLSKVNYYVVFIGGASVVDNRYYYGSLPSGVTVTIDQTENKVIVTNSTDSIQHVIVIIDMYATNW